VLGDKTRIAAGTWHSLRLTPAYLSGLGVHDGGVFIISGTGTAIAAVLSVTWEPMCTISRIWAAHFCTSSLLGVVYLTISDVVQISEEEGRRP
jgi:hypothetical protein